MKKTNRTRSYLIFLVSIFLIFGQLNLTALNVFAKESGNEELSFEVQSKLAGDKKSVDLAIKVTPTNDQIKILTIETPDGKETTGKEAVFKAEENGNTEFLVTYQNNEMEKPTTKKYTASYEVSGIVANNQEAEESKHEDSVEQNTPKETKKLFNTEQSKVTLSIPAYNQTAWSNGDIKDVTVTVEFADSVSSGKKVDFTLPDGMRFVSVPVPNNYQASANVDSGILSHLSASDPLGTAITTMTVPDKELTYNKGTFGTVSYQLDAGTEKASFTFSIRVDAAKYYGATDIAAPIKAEVFTEEQNTPVDSAEQAIHAEGNKVVGYANQEHVQTMFRNWYNYHGLPEVFASTDTVASYNYTKPYSVVNAYSQLDSRGAKFFVAKNITTTLYYPEGMEYVGVVNNNGSLMTNNSNLTITPYPEENKVVIDCKQLNYNTSSSSIFSVKYKVPEGTPTGTYTAPQIPHAAITTYDDNVFETDALTSNTADLTTLAAIDTCIVSDTTVNKMNMSTANSYINPDSESWGGSIRLDNKKTAGMKTNQIYHIEFDPNWEAYTVNLPFDGTIAGNKPTNVQYKTNLNPNYRTYSGTLPKINSNRMVTLEATAVGLEEGECFTDVKANVGDFSPGYSSAEPSASYRWSSTSSYGIVKQGITSVRFKAEVWDAADEADTKSTGTSTYSTSNSVTAAANGTAAFYNQDETAVKIASAGDTVTTKATLELFDYPYGTRTVLHNPEVYLHEVKGTTIHPSSIKLTDQDGKNVDFTVQQETAINGDKVYILKTENMTVGEFVNYPATKQYLNLSYKSTFDVTLDESINMDAQDMIAWGVPNSISAITSNCFSDTGLDVNQNGKDNEKLLSVNSSSISVPKKDTVSVETFLSVTGEGEKAAYIEGEDSTVSYFTPGTNADYTVQITNTSSGDATIFELYIPIPKTGQNFGANFQSEPFKWDMKLGGAIPITAAQLEQFEVSYATEATENNYDSASIYTDTVSEYEKVNMVRIKVKTKINAKETQTFKVPLKVDETFESATSGHKIGERDIYNPYYRVVTNTFSGSLSGTKVGAELVIGEVSGTLFNDKDVNGIYEKTNGDTPLENETVELYKWNDKTSSYEPANTTKTNAEGAYSFDYSVGVGYGDYAVKFPDKSGYKYTLKKVGTDVSADSDVPYSGADKGWVKQIDSTQPDSDYINAGYYAYEPTQDLKVNLNEKQVQMGLSQEITLPKVASTSGQAAEDTIEPAFFQNIKASTNGYKWSTADTGVATVQTLSDGSSAVVGVSTNNKTIATTDLTITIQDIFGTEQSSTAPVYVTSPAGTIVQQDGFTIGVTDFSLAYKDALNLTDAQGINLAKTAAFEEVENGVNSSAQDCLSTVEVNQTQLNAIKNGSNQGGTYPLTYSVNKDGKTAEVTIQVTVAKDLTAVNAHDSTIYVGDTWTAADNFDSALNKEGDIVPFTDVAITGTVNTSLAGTYPVTYSYNGISKQINVVVKDKLTAVNAHDSTIYTSDAWTAADNFDSALDKDGNPVDFADVTVTGTVNTNQAGTNTITYTYDGVSTTITVTVKEDKTGISAHDSSIYVGEEWTAADNFDSAFDEDGDPVSYQEVKVTEKPIVNTNKAGAYQVTYSYGKASKTITLTVKEIQTAVNAHDSTIYVDDSWSAADNFDSALDKDGKNIAFADVTVTGTVETTTAGTYPITYMYDGVSTTINVQVKDKLTAVHAHDSVVYTGDKWTEKDNFDSAVDKDGKSVDFKDITVTEPATVDLTKPGVYQVTYSYDGVSTTINVTVEPRQTSVEVHDSTIYTGDKWNAKNNFDKATDKKGDDVPFSEITVTGKVDTNKAGNYEISYSYDGMKVVAHVTVLQNQAQITVKDSTIQKGGKWSAEDNFISATNRDGKVIPFSQVEINGTVNPDKIGTYKVSYSYDPNEGTIDAGKEQLSVTATIEVKDTKVSPISPTNPSKPKDNKRLKVSSNTQHTATGVNSKPLPKTGDQTNPWGIWTGICLLGLSAFVWAFTSRRKRHQ